MDLLKKVSGDGDCTYSVGLTLPKIYQVERNRDLLPSVIFLVIIVKETAAILYNVY